EPRVDRLCAVALERRRRRDEPEAGAGVEGPRRTGAGQATRRPRARAPLGIASTPYGAVEIGGSGRDDAHRFAVTHARRHAASAAAPRGGGATAGAWMIAQPGDACDA